MEIILKYWEIVLRAYQGYADYLLSEITFDYSYKPWWENYFWFLIVISLIFFGLEAIKPWRERQSRFRQDFWLDVFYMFFNFFLFSLVIFNAAFDVFVNAFNDFLSLFGLTNIVSIHIEQWPRFAQLFVLFITRDFIHWWIHRLLHRVPALWKFHKVHHSVQEMGFAAHLRYHWMENVVYRGLEYIPIAMIGFGIDDFFIVHIFALIVGHWNHANLNIDIGPLKYIFNNPRMHIWHHAKHIPSKYGVNFGITLSTWDYLFGTAHIPYDGRDIPLGFEQVEDFPKTFEEQALIGLKKNT